MEDQPNKTETPDADVEATHPADQGLEAETDHTEDAHEPKTSTVLVEIQSGVAMVFGEVPSEMSADLVNLNLLPTNDRETLRTTVAAAAGNVASATGELGHLLESAQGLYRVSSATQELLNQGAVLAVKDGANLGSVWLNGDLVAQARFIPVSAASAAQLASALSPTLTMVALQMQLQQISGLLNTNIALTQGLLADFRRAKWAELTGLVSSIDDVWRQSGELGSLPATLWDSVSGDKSAVRKQLDSYRSAVGSHIQKLQTLTGKARREYLQTHADAIHFETMGLLKSLESWAKYQSLHIRRLRDPEDGTARDRQVADMIASESEQELTASMEKVTELVRALSRELRLLAELPGAKGLPLSSKRKDAAASKDAAMKLLASLAGVEGRLCPLRPAPLPRIIAAPDGAINDRTLAILGWLVNADEVIQAVGLTKEFIAGSVGKLIASATFPAGWAITEATRSAKKRLNKDGENASTEPDLGFAKFTEGGTSPHLVAVTDHRILVAEYRPFLQVGELKESIPLTDVRYVRLVKDSKRTPRGIDLTLVGRNLRWDFYSTTDAAQVDALAARLAVAVPGKSPELTELVNRFHPVLAPGDAPRPAVEPERETH